MGRRDDHLEAGWRLRLAADVELDAVERLQEDRVLRVPPAHLRAPALREVRVRREPGAADPDEVDAATGERQRRAHRPARARRTSSSAISSAAFGLARLRID